MKLPKITTSGSKSTITACDAVFAAPVNQVLLAQAVRVFLANQRQGSANVQRRGDVARTGKKWYRQKGTGNARHGNRRAPLFVGGSKAFGPLANRNWSLNLSKTLRRKALISALSVRQPSITVVEQLLQLDGKTKSGQQLISAIVPEAKRVLVVLTNNDPIIVRSLRNLDQVVVQQAQRLTTYEVLMADAVLLSPQAVTALEERLGSKEQGEKNEESSQDLVDSKSAKSTSKKKLTDTKKVSSKTKKTKSNTNK